MIPNFSAEDRLDIIAGALDEYGCVVVTDVMDASVIAAIRRELAEPMDQAQFNAEDDPAEFYPGKTRRITALVDRSETVTDKLLVHPVSTQLCDHFLLPNGKAGYQLHVTAALEVGPGAREQVLHREEDPFNFFDLPRPNLIVASMWAVSDFRADNGGTLLVPGSHRWPAERTPEPQEVVAAEMPAGSVLFWLGGTLHGAGANVSQDWRYGVILTYSVGWVRQEENQYLDISAQRLAALSPQVRKIAGYTMFDALGLYDPAIQKGR